MNIQWYPGHMSKTKRLIQENLKLVDIVIEIRDARIPISSKNPEIDSLINNKPRIIILNKSDLSNENITKEWINHFKSQSINAVAIDSKNGKNINSIINISKDMLKEKIERNKKRGIMFKPIRAMIIGIPNVGKSTFINKLVRKSTAKTGDKPGVTKGKQWVKIKKDFELLDTPGILWPKFDDERVGLNLAFTGAIKDDIMDMHTLSLKLLERIKECPTSVFLERFAFDDISHMSDVEIFNAIAIKRGYIKSGEEIDNLRTAINILDEFRAGRYGRISLERCEI